MYEDSENIEKYRVRTFVFNLYQIKQKNFLGGHVVYIFKYRCHVQPKSTARQNLKKVQD